MLGTIAHSELEKSEPAFKVNEIPPSSPTARPSKPELSFGDGGLDEDDDQRADKQSAVFLHRWAISGHLAPFAVL